MRLHIKRALCVFFVISVLFSSGMFMGTAVHRAYAETATPVATTESAAAEATAASTAPEAPATDPAPAPAVAAPADASPASDPSVTEPATTEPTAEAPRTHKVLRVIDPAGTLTHTYEFFNGGTKVDIQIVKDGEKLTEPANPTPPVGKQFTGWFAQTAPGATTFEKLDFTKPILVTSTGTLKVEARFTDEAKFFVTFINDGKVVAAKEVVSGNTTNGDNIPLIVTKPGQSFKWWSLTPEGLAFDFNTPITANINLHVVTDQQWSVTFNTHGGTPVAPTFVMNNGNLSGRTFTSSRIGYTFSHWSATDGGTAYNFISPITADTILHAVWAPKTDTGYTVAYWLENADNANYTLDSTAPLTGTTGATISVPAKTFAGFTLDAAKTNAQTVTIAADGSAVKNVWFSRNTYTLTFVDDYYGTNTSNPKVLGTYQVKFGADTTPKWGLATKAFTAWKVSQGVTNPAQLLPNWSTVSSNVNYTVKYPITMPAENKKFINVTAGSTLYTTYYLEQGTNTQIATPARNAMSQGFPLQPIDYVELPGYTLVSKHGDGSQTPIADGYLLNEYGSAISQKYKFNLYYKRASFDLIFNPADGNPNITVSAIPYQASLAGKAPSQYVAGTTTNADGKVFAGWYLNVLGTAGAEANLATMTMPASQLMVYAKWVQPNVKVTAHYSGADPAATFVQPVVRGGTANQAELESKRVAPAGATEADFLGWYWFVNGVFTKYDFNMPVYNDVEIFAKWKQNGVQVTYILNGGSGAVTDENYYLPQSVAAVQPATAVVPPTGKVFLGWKSGVDGKLYYPNQALPIGNTAVNMTAQWGDVALTTTLTYDANGGTPPSQVINLLNNTTHTVLENTFAWEGYDFVGWNTKANGSGTAYQAGAKILVDAIDSASNVLYAQWSKQVSATATKTWVNGPTPRPTVWFKLWRQVEGGTAEAVLANGQPMIKELADGTTSVTWDGLTAKDANGKNYTFSVTEVNSTGEASVPTNYLMTGAGSLTITNTYVIPTNGTASATKVWSGGDATNRPTVYFQLWRQVDGGTAEAVPNSVKTLAAGTTTADWTALETTDKDGKAYTFSVKEVKTAAGTEVGAPANYGSATNGMTITNTYAAPSGGIANATKEWKTVSANAPLPADKPTVWFQLWRQVEGGTAEAVPGSIKELASGTTTVSWEALTENDNAGKPYTFTAKEVDASGTSFVPEGYVKTGDGTKTITNTYSPDVIVVTDPNIPTPDGYFRVTFAAVVTGRSQGTRSLT